jgi:hypothetical protein
MVAAAGFSLGSPPDQKRFQVYVRAWADRCRKGDIDRCRHAGRARMWCCGFRSAARGLVVVSSRSGGVMASFINPYTFVPLPDEIIRAAPFGHDRSEPGRVSGRMTVTWTVRTRECLDLCGRAVIALSFR